MTTFHETTGIDWDDPDRDFFRKRPRIYIHASDTNGGIGDPTTHSHDPDGEIATLFRSSPLKRWQYLVGTYQREGSIPYFADEVVRLHNEIYGPCEYPARGEVSAWRSRVRRKTQIVLNGAPRIGQEISASPSDEHQENGQHFYTSRIGDVQVVGPAAAFSTLCDRISILYRLNGENVGWPKNTPFRSSFVGDVARNTKLYERVSPASVVPVPPDLSAGYFDNWGCSKVLVRNQAEVVHKLLEAAHIIHDGELEGQTVVPLSILGKRLEVILALGENDALNTLPRVGNHIALWADRSRPLLDRSIPVPYRGRLTLSFPWRKGLTGAESIQYSPYVQFGRPAEGSEITIG